MSITGTINTRAGSGTIEIDHVSLGTQTAQIADVGVIDIDYDFQDEYSNEVEGLYFGSSEFTVRLFDKLSDGSSLFDDLDGIVSTDDIDLVLDFTTDDGFNWEDLYTFTKNDIEYKREERAVEITAVSRGDAEGVTIESIFSSLTPEPQGSGFQVGTDIVLPRDFLAEYASRIPTSTQPRTIENQSSAFGFFEAHHKQDGEESFVICDIDETSPATDLLFRMAAMDGSIIGNLLGYFFIVHRLSTVNATVVTEDDISSLELDPGLENFRLAQMTFIDNDGGFVGFPDNLLIEQYTPDNADLNVSGTKSLKIYIRADQVKRVEWDEANSEFNRNLGAKSEGISNDVTESQIVIPVNDASTFSVDDMCVLQHISSGGDFVADSTLHPRDVYRITSVDTGNNEITLSDPVVRDYSDDAPFGPRVIAQTGPLFSPSTMSHALDGYMKAYGATGEKRIKFELFDIDIAKPYDVIEFDSSNISAIQGLTFRPSKMSYNIIKDTIGIEAYEIG